MAGDFLGLQTPEWYEYDPVTRPNVVVQAAMGPVN